MQIIKGGYDFVEVDSDPTFTNPTRIGSLLKSGTSLVPFSPTDELASGKQVSAGKGMKINLRTADHNATLVAMLKAAELAQTPLYLRYFGRNVETLVANCDTPGQSFQEGDIFVAADTVNKIEGIASEKITIPHDCEVGVMADLVVTGGTLRAKGGVIRFWAKVDEAVSAGAFEIEFASDSAAIPFVFPALTTEWKELQFTYGVGDAPPTDEALTGIILSLHEIFDNVLWIDNVRHTYPLVSFKAPFIPKVEEALTEFGKLNAIRISGEAVADTEDNLLTLNI